VKKKRLEGGKGKKLLRLLIREGAGAEKVIRGEGKTPF